MFCISIFVYIYLRNYREDRSSTGHILGRAQLQPPKITPQRNLNPMSCSVLRCLMHAAMLLGTDQDMQVSPLVFILRLL